MTRDGRKRWRLALVGLGVVALSLTLGVWLRAGRGPSRGADRVLGLDARGRLFETTHPIPGLRAVRVTRQLSGGATKSITVGLDLSRARSR
jgi:hypothetical protein